MALIVVLRNISQLAEVSDYDYQVLVGDGTVMGSRIIDRGQVVGHHRSDGWHELVSMMLRTVRDKEEGKHDKG